MLETDSSFFDKGILLLLSALPKKIYCDQIPNLEPHLRRDKDPGRVSNGSGIEVIIGTYDG